MQREHIASVVTKFYTLFLYIIENIKSDGSRSSLPTLDIQGNQPAMTRVYRNGRRLHLMVKLSRDLSQGVSHVSHIIGPGNPLGIV